MDRIDTAVLLLRLLVGSTMIIHGLNHAFGGGKLPGTARWFESIGLRHGRVQALMSCLVEVAGGGGIALGLLTFLSGASVVGVMLVAIVTAHRSNGFFVFKDGYEYVLFIIITVLGIVVAGPGKASVDHAIGLHVSAWAGATLTAGLAIVGVALLLAATYRPNRTNIPEPSDAEAQASA
jgi:putative oxidoreductase